MGARAHPKANANATGQQPPFVPGEPAGGADRLGKGRWKLNWYVGYPPGLFDLQEDPDQVNARAFPDQTGARSVRGAYVAAGFG